MLRHATSPPWLALTLAGALFQAVYWTLQLHKAFQSWEKACIQLYYPRAIDLHIYHTSTDPRGPSPAPSCPTAGHATPPPALPPC